MANSYQIVVNRKLLIANANRELSEADIVEIISNSVEFAKEHYGHSYPYQEVAQEIADYYNEKLGSIFVVCQIV